VELAPRDSHHAPSACLKAAVAGAVLLEGLTGVVEGEAVELGDQAVRRPDEVDLHFLNEGVDGRARQNCVIDEGDEAGFELRSCEGRDVVVLVEL
jgi:hypothetical protein